MECRSASDTEIVVTLSKQEAVVLHEALAFGDWSGVFEDDAWQDPLFVAMLGRLQLVLAPQIVELGTADYGSAVARALDAVRADDR